LDPWNTTTQPGRGFGVKCKNTIFNTIEIPSNSDDEADNNKSMASPDDPVGLT
jgi:hypothetical protein